MSATNGNDFLLRAKTLYLFNTSQKRPVVLLNVLLHVTLRSLSQDNEMLSKFRSLGGGRRAYSTSLIQ